MVFFTLSARRASLSELKGKVAVVTGANTGIGKCTVKYFYERSARVILACRNLNKAQEAIHDIKKQCKNKGNLGELEAVKLDLSSLKSVRTCAQYLLCTEKNINILTNNAGVMMCPYAKTEDGFEMQFATNHLGHFLLTLMLMPKLVQSTPVRIVNVSSLAHAFSRTIDLSDLNWERKKYSPLFAYSQSKLANVLFTKELARQFKENNIQGINVYCVHPGVVKTELSRHLNSTYSIPGVKWISEKMASYISKTPEQGAQTQIYCATNDKCANETGLYYSDCRVTTPSRVSQNKELGKKLWKESLKLVGLKQDYNPFKMK